MEINKELLRKYILLNKSLNKHIEDVAIPCLFDSYINKIELKFNMKFALNKIEELEKIEDELLKELDKK